MIRAWSRRDFLLVSGGAAAAGLLGCGDNRVRLAPDAGAAGDGSACAPSRADLVGPFFIPGAPMRVTIADPGEPGERLALTGRIVGTDCTTAIGGVLVDVWQADRDGTYYTAAQNYRLRGEVTTDATGTFHLETIKPGRYLQGNGYRPAHIHFTFTHPAYQTLTTQIYFAGDPYLAPADSCGSCGSDDRDRILALAGDASSGWTGELRIVLAGSGA